MCALSLRIAKLLSYTGNVWCTISSFTYIAIVQRGLCAAAHLLVCLCVASWRTILDEGKSAWVHALHVFVEECGILGMCVRRRELVYTDCSAGGWRHYPSINLSVTARLWRHRRALTASLLPGGASSVDIAVCIGQLRSPIAPAHLAVNKIWCCSCFTMSVILYDI